MVSSRIGSSRFRTLLIAVHFALLLIAASFASDRQGSVDISVAVPPTLVPVGSTRELVYEVRLRNLTSGPIELRELMVIDDTTNKTLQAWFGKSLAQGR